MYVVAFENCQPLLKEKKPLLVLASIIGITNSFFLKKTTKKQVPRVVPAVPRMYSSRQEANVHKKWCGSCSIILSDSNFIQQLIPAKPGS